MLFVRGGQMERLSSMWLVDLLHTLMPGPLMHVELLLLTYRTYREAVIQ